MTSSPVLRLLARATLVFAALGLAPAARAEPAPGDSAPRFRTLGWGVRAADLHYTLEGKDVPVPVFEAGRSGFLALPAGETLSFHRVIKKTDGRVERLPVALAALAEAGPLPLLVFLPDPAASDRYRVVTVPDDLATFPDRACRFVNLTPVTLHATVGESTVAIPGGEIRTVDIALGGESGSRHTSVYVKRGDDSVMLAYNNWVFRPGQRTLVFIFLDPWGNPQVVRVVDGVRQLPPVPAP